VVGCTCREITVRSFSRPSRQSYSDGTLQLTACRSTRTGRKEDDNNNNSEGASNGHHGNKGQTRFPGQVGAVLGSQQAGGGSVPTCPSTSAESWRNEEPKLTQWTQRIGDLLRPRPSGGPWVRRGQVFELGVSRGSPQVLSDKAEGSSGQRKGWTFFAGTRNSGKVPFAAVC